MKKMPQLYVQLNNLKATISLEHVYVRDRGKDQETFPKKKKSALMY